MLGSLHDADDALQETLLRAWRGAAGLRGTGKSWLYAIATNVCLTEIGRRRSRVLPHDFGPAAEGSTPPGAPLAETVWLEPYPSRYEEGVELAFVAAVQHLAPQQRAVLLLREVMGFSAEETAGMLESTVPSVNSALQRARAAVSARVPEPSQRSTLRALGEARLRELVRRYLDAWERCDVDAFLAMLVQDATFAMPPLSTWYAGREVIGEWARRSSMSGLWRWRALETEANAQPALAFYALTEGVWLPFALNVLSFRGEQISDVTAFIVRSTASQEPESYVRFPEQPMNELGIFERFGLPACLD